MFIIEGRARVVGHIRVQLHVQWYTSVDVIYIYNNAAK